MRAITYAPILQDGVGIVVVDVPQDWRGSGLALGRFTYALYETPAELSHLRQLLTRAATAADLDAIMQSAAARPSRYPAEAVEISMHAAPIDAHPHFVVVRWAADLAAVAQATCPGALNRGVYTVEAASSSGDAAECAAGLLHTLQAMGATVMMLSAGEVGSGGTA